MRGFGFNHDGIEATPEQFLGAFVFVQTTVPVTFGGITFPPNPGGIPFFTDPSNPLTPDPKLANPLSTQGLQMRRALSSYILAFDTNMFPVVGQQATLTASSAPALASRIALFEAQAAAGHADLVARTTVGGIDAGFVWTPAGWQSAVSSAPLLTDAQLQQLAKASPVTFMCVPPGEGWRVGVDRDGDGYADGDELRAGTSPANPASYPGHS